MPSWVTLNARQVKRRSERVRRADVGIKPGVSAANPGETTQMNSRVREASDGLWVESTAEFTLVRTLVSRTFLSKAAVRSADSFSFRDRTRGSVRSPRALCCRPLRGLVRSSLLAGRRSNYPLPGTFKASRKKILQTVCPRLNGVVSIAVLTINGCRNPVQPIRRGQIECIAHRKRTRIERGIHFDLRQQFLLPSGPKYGH